MRQHALIIILLFFAGVLEAQEADSVKHRITRQWTLSGDYSEEVNTPLDTTFALCHQFKLADKYSPFNTSMGNFGLPFYQINFFDRVTDPDKFLYRYYYPIMHLTDKPVFMDTQVPFTELSYDNAGPRERAEQALRIRHSQNASKYLNFGVIFDVIFSLGQYSYQRADDKNFNYYSSYTGDKYKFYLSGAVNNQIVSENGGITDPSQLSTFDTRDIQVNLGNLNEAQSLLKNRNILIVQRFTFNKKSPSIPDTIVDENKRKGLKLNGTLSHIFAWDKTRSTYSDNYPQGGFYDSSYISNVKTFDSLSMRVIKNTIRFDFSTDETRKFSLGGGVGIRNELFRYGQIIPAEASPPSDTAVWKNSNNVLVGRLFNTIGNKFRWVATGELFFTGYRAGDFDLRGTITKDFEWKKGGAKWDIQGRVSNTTPSFWFNRYGSNHFNWENDLLNEFRIDAGTGFYYPEGRLSAKFNYAIIDNHAYFGPGALPVRHSGGLSVLSAFVKKEFSAWKFHLANEILVQKTSNSDVVDLPLVTLRTAGFFEHNIHFNLTDGNLNTQFGVELFYNTSYNGYSYMPATGVFYQGQGGQVGNYPYMNAFINIKVKRTRIFLVFDHVNSGFTGYNYFMVPSCPVNVRMFRYGFAWTFYD